MIEYKNAKQATKLIKHIIETNLSLSNCGKSPLAIELEGPPGIGKTDLCRQIAEFYDMKFVKLTLSQYDDLGDFVGYPVPSYEVELGDKKFYVKQPLLDSFLKSGYVPTGNARSENCPPEWLAGVDKPMLLLIDDWTRAQPRFIQAMMELIETQTYASNILPKGSTILLTANPDDGNNKVNYVDAATRTRFGTIKYGFSLDTWEEWAEQHCIDSRCINFWHLNPDLYVQEELKPGSDSYYKLNPRSITKFFNAISTLEDYNDIESQGIINDLATAFVTPEFAATFLSFINANLDRIPSPSETLNGDYDEIRKIILSLINQDVEIDNMKHEKEVITRSDIFYTIEHRLVLYTKIHKSEMTKKMIDNIYKMVIDKEFPKDIRLDLCKSVYGIMRGTDLCKEWLTDKHTKKMLIA